MLQTERDENKEFFVVVSKSSLNCVKSKQHKNDIQMRLKNHD